jgi:hypothetical protein
MENHNQPSDNDSLATCGAAKEQGAGFTNYKNAALVDNLLVPREEQDMGKTRGRQKGYLRAEGRSWIGHWWEEIRLLDGRLYWHRTSKKICETTRISEAGRNVKVTKHEAQRVFQDTILDKLEIRTTNPQSLATLKEFVDLKFRPTLVLKRRRKHASTGATCWTITSCQRSAGVSCARSGRTLSRR